MSDTATRSRSVSSVRDVLSAPLLLVSGVVVIPFLLSVLFNSWSAPDADAYVRMAFASVAGATLGIITVTGLLFDRIIHRSSPSTIALFATIAVVVTLLSVQSIASSAELLLQRLNL